MQSASPPGCATLCYMGERQKVQRPASVVRETSQTVGVRELRQNLSVYLDRVKAGEALTVTEHGEKVAILRPMPLESSMLERLVAEGKARRPTRLWKDVPPPLEVKLDKELSQILQEMRDKERY